MPKRSRKDEDSNDYFHRKIRRLESELRRRRKKFVISSDSSSSSSASPVPFNEEDVDSEQSLIDVAAPESPNLDIVVAEPPAANKNNDGGPSPNEQAPATACALDDEILSMLGETPSKEKKYAAEIQHDLAIRWEHISTLGLSKEAKKELIEKRLVPSNCKKIEAPVLNPEIKAALTEALLKKDKALENKQKQLAAAISYLSEGLTMILSSEHRDPKIIKLLIEAGRIMCDSQHTESLTRRSFICSTIKKELKDQLYDTDIDQFLFGEKLADTLKAAKAINKSAADMKAPVFKPSTNKNKASTSKNFKFPQNNSRQKSTEKPTQANPAPAPTSPAHRRKLPPPPKRSSKARASTARR